MPSGPELHSNVLVAGLNITLDPFRDYETALMSGTALSKNIQGEGALEGDRVPAIRVEGINTKEEQERKYSENVEQRPSLHPRLCV